MLFSFILVILIVGFFTQGWKDGLIQTAGRVIGAFIGFLIARAWSVGLAFIFEILLPSNWSRLIAFLVIFVFITQIAGVVFKIADHFFRIVTILPIIKSVNSLAGGILGLLEGILMLGGTMWVINTFSLFAFITDLVKTSTVAHGISAAFSVLISWAP